eukprot:scaffold434_cov358-Prasinococcus_capsulatus_cf.AAC.2
MRRPARCPTPPPPARAAAPAPRQQQQLSSARTPRGHVAHAGHRCLCAVPHAPARRQCPRATRGLQGTAGSWPGPAAAAAAVDLALRRRSLPSCPLPPQHHSHVAAVAAGRPAPVLLQLQYVWWLLSPTVVAVGAAGRQRCRHRWRCRAAALGLRRADHVARVPPRTGDDVRVERCDVLHRLLRLATPLDELPPPRRGAARLGHHLAAVALVVALSQVRQRLVHLAVGDSELQHHRGVLLPEGRRVARLRVGLHPALRLRFRLAVERAQLADQHLDASGGARPRSASARTSASRDCAWAAAAAAASACGEPIPARANDSAPATAQCRTHSRVTTTATASVHSESAGATATAASTAPQHIVRVRSRTSGGRCCRCRQRRSGCFWRVVAVEETSTPARRASDEPPKATRASAGARARARPSPSHAPDDVVGVAESLQVSGARQQLLAALVEAGRHVLGGVERHNVHILDAFHPKLLLVELDAAHRAVHREHDTVVDAPRPRMPRGHLARQRQSQRRRRNSNSSCKVSPTLVSRATAPTRSALASAPAGPQREAEGCRVGARRARLAKAGSWCGWRCRRWRSRRAGSGSSARRRGAFAARAVATPPACGAPRRGRRC